MKYIAIFFTDKNFREREIFLLEYLKLIGFDEVISYKKEWLETTEFYLENKEILDLKRGCGYWLWKPYIIIETMKNINENDVVFYMDAGDYISNNVLSLIKDYIKNNDYIITNLDKDRPLNKRYTKTDCFNLMNCNDDKYYNVRQVEAGILVFKKNDFILKFLDEWLFYCKNKNIITDIPNITGNNFDCFIDHRHDQSIITNLTVKYNMTYSNVLYKEIIYNNYKIKK